MVIRSLAVLFLLFNMSACCPTYLPCRVDLYPVKYAPDWVCVQKAVAAQGVLSDNGIINRICCGECNGSGHCWNEVYKDGRWFMCDMHSFYFVQGFPIEYYPEYTREDFFYQRMSLR